MTEQASSMKWTVLVLVAAADFCVVGLSWMVMPVLFGEIMGKTGWTLQAIMLAWGLIPLAMVFITLPAGILGDKYGIRWIPGLGMVAAGITGAMRGMFDSVTMFQIAMLLYGCSFPFAFILMPKALATYFPPEELGKANGIAMGCYGAGGGLALLLGGSWISPHLGGWQNVVYLFGAVTVIVGIIWLSVIKPETAPAPAGAPGAPAVSILGLLIGLLKNPSILVLCLIYFLFNGGWIGMAGIFPVLAPKVRGMTPQAAGSVIAFALWLYVVGNMIIPRYSDKIGKRRIVYCIGLLLSGLGMFLTCMFPPPSIWIWMGLWGLTSGTITIVFVIPFEMKEVGPAMGGMAMAVIMIAGSLGAFSFPVITGYMVKAMDPSSALIGIGVLCGLIGYSLTGLLIWGVKETGWKFPQK